MPEPREGNQRTGFEIAVIGMAGRLPGARDINEFWENLKNGVESIAFVSEEDLAEMAADPDQVKNPGYVRSIGGHLRDKECFDAAFFGYTPGEATLMDPQMRVLHETAWAALEDAGYDPGRYEGLIGIYAGESSTFLWEALTHTAGATEQAGSFMAMQFMDRSFLSTRISYRLNLRGPAITVQTACSTSLVAIHLASRGILSGECDMALAGGVSLGTGTGSGYVYKEGMILSPDGHCRAFDAAANGTVGGEGVGVVVLKPLEDAITHKDFIYAVIKGTAINNDGARKVGFSAPSIEGQAEAIKSAMIMAEVEANSIRYIETHGTGTGLGDPVEIQALKLAFNTPQTHFCGLGSVKTNIGHLDAAAGVTGFIKTVLLLKHRLLPPSLHFTTLNPKIVLENSPFYIVNRLIDWKDEPYPLRAGVSAFGIGGTNAHVVLEEWRDTAGACSDGTPCPPAPSRNPQLILLSAQTPTALEHAGSNLADHLKTHPGLNPEDISYTLQLGRKAGKHRRMLVGDSIAGIIAQLTTPGTETVRTFEPDREASPVAFMFPGQGAQYVNMGLQLYESEPVFRGEMDRCFEVLKPLAGYDIKEILFPSAVPSVSSVAKNKEINRTDIAQPLIFAVEYALAMLLRSWGIKPAAMVGHSIGEYTAACLAGVLSLEEALRIVSIRGRLMRQVPPGDMLGVSLSEQELQPLLPPEVALAAVNSPIHCVVSGPAAAVTEFADLMQSKGIQTRKLHTSHAFHSAMMDPILEEYAVELKKIRLNKPNEPVISNLTGHWLSDRQAIDPGYWVEHLRRTVRFHDGIKEILNKNILVLVEVGPGNSLSTFARQVDNGEASCRSVNLMRHPRESTPDNVCFLEKIGQLWLYGVPVDWETGRRGGQARRIPLPSYPFERQRYRIEGDPFKMREQLSTEKQLLKLIEKIVAADGVDALRRILKASLLQIEGMEGDINAIPEGVVIRQNDGQNDGIHRRRRPALSRPYTPPRNEGEETLARIWQDFFGIETIGIHDDFFELGGDSLRATALLAKIHKDMNLSVPIAAFFNQANIKGLALFCSTLETGGGKGDYLSIEPVEEREYYELSPAQARLFVMQQMQPEHPVYNMPDVMVLEGEIDKERMNQTFCRLIARHESLRTSYEIIGTRPRQKIHKAVVFALEIYDPGVSVAGGGKADREHGVIRQFIRPFDLARAPLLRVGLLETGENRHLLMLDIHHIAADGASVAILFDEFLALYRGDGLPPPRLQYRDFSQWQNRRSRVGEIQKQEQYWLKEFETPAPLPRLPLDNPRPQQQGFAGDNLKFDLGEETTAKLREMARSENVTLFVLLLAIYNVFLAKVGGQEDIVAGTVAAGRTHADLENIIGMFVNTLALRNYPKPVKPFNEFLREVKTRTLEAFDNQEYQFDDLVEKLKPRRDGSRAPLFDVMFSYLTRKTLTRKTQAESQEEANAVKFPLRAEPYPFEFNESKFDLILGIVETGKDLHCAIQYSTALFKPITVEKFMKYFRHILDVVLENPSIPLKDIALGHDLKALEMEVYKQGDSEFVF